MKKTMLAVAAVVALTTAASAQPDPRYPHRNWVAPTTGVVAGSVVGAGFADGWWGAHQAGTTFPTSAAGAAATGLVVGIGTAALIHAATTPCQGFHALFGNLLTTSDGCVGGQWVGDGPRLVRNDGPRVVRRR